MLPSLLSREISLTSSQVASEPSLGQGHDLALASLVALPRNGYGEHTLGRSHGSLRLWPLTVGMARAVARCTGASYRPMRGPCVWSLQPGCHTSHNVHVSLGHTGALYSCCCPMVVCVHQFPAAAQVAAAMGLHGLNPCCCNPLPAPQGRRKCPDQGCPTRQEGQQAQESSAARVSAPHRCSCPQVCPTPTPCGHFKDAPGAAGEGGHSGRGRLHPTAPRC